MFQNLFLATTLASLASFAQASDEILNVSLDENKLQQWGCLAKLVASATNLEVSGFSLLTITLDWFEPESPAPDKHADVVLDL